MNEKFEQLMAALPALLAAWGMSLLAAIVTLIFGFVVAGWLARMTMRGMRRFEKIDPLFHPLPGKVVRIAVIVFTLIAVLNRFGVATTSIIAMLGAAGLAVGLALQGTLSNVASGVMILLFRPFKIGDAVKIEGEVYVIDGIGFFMCKAHLPDGPKSFVPNSKIWGQTIVNLSVTDRDTRRIDESYGIAYDDDINKALDILKGVAAQEPRILKDPAPLIAVQSLGDNSVNILFRAWTARADWFDTKLALLKRCKEALEAGGCSIPFPQRDVRVVQMLAPSSEGRAPV